MRLLGNVADQHDAATVVDYLLTVGIGAKAERQGDGWELWVLDEDRVPDARREFAEFQSDPRADKYAAAAKEADRLRRERIDKTLEAQRNTIRLNAPNTVSSQGRRPVTMVLFTISAMLLIFSNFGEKREAFRWFEITSLTYSGDYVSWHPGLPEIRAGQVWRLVSPIFIHFDLMHFLFDMWVLFSLGTQVETRRGPWLMLGLCLTASVVGNLGDFWWSGPTFGGMSGVDFALFGYCWMKSRYEPWSGLALPPQTIYWMIGFFIFCLSGLAGPIANFCHAGGLLTGMVFGAAPTVLNRLRGGR